MYEVAVVAGGMAADECRLTCRKVRCGYMPVGYYHCCAMVES